MNNLDIIVAWHQNRQINPITKKAIKANGPTFNKFKKSFDKFFPDQLCVIDCMEDRDPISLELFWVMDGNTKKIVYPDISKLILYCDNNMLHCFEENTIKHLKHYNIKHHPVNQTLIPDSIFNKVQSIQIELTIEQKAKSIFQIFTHISVFIDSSEFLALSSDRLNKLHYEIKDFYGHNIPIMHRNEINSFMMPIEQFIQKSADDKKRYLLECFDKLLHYENDGVKYMCNYIIIAGLCCVLPSIKQTYPDFSFDF